MNDDIKKFMHNAYQNLKEKEHYDMQIHEITSLKNEDGTVGYKALAISNSDPDSAMYICENIKGKDYCTHVFEWDYDIDDYLFQDLQNHYKIEYISFEEHYAIWSRVNNELRDEIYHIEGLQGYLSYCQKNGINAQILSTMYDKKNVDIDISDLYKETNEGYKIISETNINNRSIVLGFNSHLSSKYATWSTTPNRHNGFILGQYYSNYNEAYNDYILRCNRLLLNHLEFENKKTVPKKEQKHHER